MTGSDPKRPFSLDDVDWAALGSVDDAEIAAQVASDPDTAPILDEKWFRDATLVLPGQTASLAPVDDDVLQAFRARGGDVGRHMGAALRDYAMRNGWLAGPPANTPAPPRRSRRKAG